MAAAAALAVVYNTILSSIFNLFSLRLVFFRVFCLKKISWPAFTCIVNNMDMDYTYCRVLLIGIEIGSLVVSKVFRAAPPHPH